MKKSWTTKTSGQTVEASHVNDLQSEVNSAVTAEKCYLNATGSGNAFVLTYTPDALGSYAEGMRFRFKANHSITGASTLNVNGLGAKALKKRTTSGLADLAANDIRSGHIVTCFYDGAVMQMESIITDAAGGGGGSSAALSYVCNGRLTLESGVAVSTTDQADKTTIYFTPYKGDQVALYNGSSWAYHTLTELSLALGTLTAGKNYDVFLYDNAGTLALELSAAWTDDTTRADALTVVSGVRLKSVDTTRRLVGTLRTTSTTVTQDTARQRLLWNEQNRVRRPVIVKEATDSWQYTTATWRQANGSTGNQIEIVCGEAGVLVELDLIVNSVNSVANRAVGIGVASTTTPDQASSVGRYADAAAPIIPHHASYRGAARLGYTNYVWLEYSAASGTTTWYGDGGSPAISQSGMVGWVEA